MKSAEAIGREGSRERGDASASKPGSSNTGRVMSVVEVLSRYPNGVRLEQLATETGLGKSSTHRALQALRRSGYVEQESRGPYRLTLKLVQLALSYYDGLDLPRMINPILEDLAERFAGTAHYAELDGGEIVYLAKVDGGQTAVRLTSAIGGRNPAHSTGVGKALLADRLRTMEAVADYVGRFGPLQQRTARTITSATGLARELELTRARGYAVDTGENEEVITCVALAVHLTSMRRATGAISVTRVAATITEEAQEIASEMRATIAQGLGNVLL